MKRTCAHCEREFNCPPSSNYVHCTHACRVAAGRVRLERCCEFCGTIFKLPDIGRDRRFCSTWCAGKAVAAKSRGGLLPPSVFAAVWLPLGDDVFTLVDEADAETLRAYTWSLKNGYAATWVPGRNTFVVLHQFLLNGPEIDHIDRNRLNNRRDNLRVVTRLQNVLNRGLQKNNTSGFKGVTRCGQKWKAQVGGGHGRRHEYLGLFEAAGEAAMAYDKRMREIYGDFAVVNGELQ